MKGRPSLWGSALYSPDMDASGGQTRQARDYFFEAMSELEASLGVKASRVAETEHLGPFPKILEILEREFAPKIATLPEQVLRAAGDMGNTLLREEATLIHELEAFLSQWNLGYWWTAQAAACSLGTWQRRGARVGGVERRWADGAGWSRAHPDPPRPEPEPALTSEERAALRAIAPTLTDERIAELERKYHLRQPVSRSWDMVNSGYLQIRTDGPTRATRAYAREHLLQAFDDAWPAAIAEAKRQGFIPFRQRRRSRSQPADVLLPYRWAAWSVVAEKPSTSIAAAYDVNARSVREAVGEVRALVGLGSGG